MISFLASFYPSCSFLVYQYTSKHHYYNCFIELFTQTRNKKARILSNATAAQKQIKFPIGWEVNYGDFYRDTMAFQKEGKMAHDDNADAITGVVERLGRSVFSFD